MRHFTTVLRNTCVPAAVAVAVMGVAGATAAAQARPTTLRVAGPIADTGWGAPGAAGHTRIDTGWGAPSRDA
ncbi:hypothetical protein [Streptomyces vinaceus]|uniref:hypothetical protein n=1 Tax=Streptomyces vinaceus TaxID=1960 RepID=UPI0016756AAC|nr:hypothetical protein [Streptomyces vinaceus]GHE73728.1 hypothetical protein GCM10017778_68840 [Streptomyces vinaceus]